MCHLFLFCCVNSISTITLPQTTVFPRSAQEFSAKPVWKIAYVRDVTVLVAFAPCIWCFRGREDLHFCRSRMRSRLEDTGRKLNHLVFSPNHLAKSCMPVLTVDFWIPIAASLLLRNLNGNQLSGSIPPELGQLVNLTSL